MMREQLRERIVRLSARLCGLGIGAGISALSCVELWGLHRFLLRLADG